MNIFHYKYPMLILMIFNISYLSAQINGSITHDNLERTYILHVPSSYDAANPAPLVFNLHGYGSNATQQFIYGDFRSLADTDGFLVVHPQGTLDDMNSAFWNANWGAAVDDVGFISALIDSLSASYNIDLNRVYSTGMSNGGFMSYTLACQLSDRIAAIASVTGTMTIGQACNEPKEVPVMQIHGTADGVVAYGGSNLGMGIDNVIDFWVNKNGCDTNPQSTMIPDIDTTDASTAEHYVYTNGTNGSSVEFYKIIDGGHTWPGAIFNIGVTNQDINASEEIWRFFSKYTLDGLVTSTEQNHDEPRISIQPNPATDIIQLTFDNNITEKYMLNVYDMTGREIQRISSSDNTLQINVSDWMPSTYFIRLFIDNQLFTNKIIIAN